MKDHPILVLMIGLLISAVLYDLQTHKRLLATMSRDPAVPAATPGPNLEGMYKLLANLSRDKAAPASTPVPKSEGVYKFLENYLSRNAAAPAATPAPNLEEILTNLPQDAAGATSMPSPKLEEIFKLLANLLRDILALTPEQIPLEVPEATPTPIPLPPPRRTDTLAGGRPFKNLNPPPDAPERIAVLRQQIKEIQAQKRQVSPYYRGNPNPAVAELDGQIETLKREVLKLGGNVLFD